MRIAIFAAMVRIMNREKGRKDVLVDTEHYFPDPEVFAALVEKHVDDAMKDGFNGVNVTYFHPGKGWQVLEVPFDKP